MQEADELQATAIDIATKLRLGELSDNSELEYFAANIYRLSREWKSTGNVDIATASVLVAFYPMTLGCASIFSGQEYYRYDFIVHRLTDEIARALTDNCYTLRDMVRNSLTLPAQQGAAEGCVEGGSELCILTDSALPQGTTPSKLDNLTKAVARAEKAVTERRPDCVEHIRKVEVIVVKLAPSWRHGGYISRELVSLLVSIYPAVNWALVSNPYDSKNGDIDMALGALQDSVESSLDILPDRSRSSDEIAD